LGKRKSTRHQKPKTGPRQAVRRATGVYKASTSEHRRVTSQMPATGGRSSSSLDMGVGVKYAALVSAAVIAVVIGTAMSITTTIRDEVGRSVTDMCLETAKAVAVAARPALEQGTASSLDLGPLMSQERSPTAKLLSVVVLDAGNVEAVRQPKTGPTPGKNAVKEKYSTYTVLRDTVRSGPAVAVELKVYSALQGKHVGAVMVTRSASRVEKAAGAATFPVVMIGAGVLAAAVFLTFMLAGRTGEEMGKVGVQMRRMDKQLRSAKEKEKVIEHIEHDLDAARDIQANLLPPKIPQIPGYDVFPFYRSAKEVGGDYYDFFPIDSRRLAMVVADVSGKSIPGSMVMATTRTVLRLLGPQLVTASAIMQQTNAWVAKDIKRGMFVTAIFAVLDVRTREMAVCSAGHNPMVVFRERTGECELVNPNGIALGFDAGPIFDRTLQERRITLEGGDRVVMYTDGVVEAMSEEHEEYGDERFYRFVRDHARMRSKDFVLALVRDLDEHKGSAEQHDDITISTFRTMG
jgi:serine phosphatase RsbU (regulator of sigma subunit)